MGGGVGGTGLARGDLLSLRRTGRDSALGLDTPCPRGGGGFKRPAASAADPEKNGKHDQTNCSKVGSHGFGNVIIIFFDVF